MCIPLKINEDTYSEDQNGSSNLLFRTSETDITPYKPGRLSFIEKYSAKTVPTKKWKTPRIVTGKRWYVEYYYRSPVSQKWVRFRVFEDINREKTMHYAITLREAVLLGLKEGFNPFELQEAEPVLSQKFWTVQQGLTYFIQHCEGKGLEKTSLYKYKQSVNFFLTWAKSVGVLHDDIKNLTTHHVGLCLNDGLSKGWANRNYNNVKSFLSTCFIYLMDKKIMDINPCKGMAKKKTLTKKHKAYNKSSLEKIVSMLKEHDPYIYFVTRIIYYLCIRSNKELKNLKIKHIDIERMQVWVMAENAKTDKDRTVPMCEEMLRIFEEQGIFSGNPDHYVVTGRSKPGPKRFGTNFLSKRFGRVRDKAGLTQDSTLYAFKHTRVIHLKLDGAPDPDIMALTGHTSFQAYSDYLRDLGMDVDPKEINKYTRVM